MGSPSFARRSASSAVIHSHVHNPNLFWVANSFINLDHGRWTSIIIEINTDIDLKANFTPVGSITTLSTGLSPNASYLIWDVVDHYKNEENIDDLAWILIKRGGTVARVLSLRKSLTSTLYLVWPPAALTTSSSALPKSPKVIVITISGYLFNGNTSTVMLVIE